MIERSAVDARVRKRLLAGLEAPREELAQRLCELREHAALVTADHEALAAFRRRLLELVERNEYEFAGPAEQARQLLPRAFAAWVMEDLAAALRSNAAHGSVESFDRLVLGRFATLAMAYYTVQGWEFDMPGEAFRETLAEHRAGPSEPLAGPVTTEVFEACMQALAVIRTCFETAQVFPDDAELWREMTAIIRQARSNLTRPLATLRDELRACSPQEPGVEIVKQRLLDLAVFGADPWTLDRELQVDVFRASTAGGRYRFRFRPPDTASALMALPAPHFVARVVEEVLAAVSDDDHYVDGPTFDRKAFCPVAAFLWATGAAAPPQRESQE
jgi:hypothetical protein